MNANRKVVLKNDILSALKEIGVSKGQSIMVHTSLSSLGFVCGGPQIVIEALLESVGEEGTIMMPTQSWKDGMPKDCAPLRTSRMPIKRRLMLPRREALIPTASLRRL